MKTRLKRLRVSAGMTQARAAAAIGVSQPNYHRWEAGTAAIPEAKLKKLAKVFKTTPEAILGKHAPVEAAFYDDTVGDELNYYGEVAFHFRGGGEPLLLSISEAECARLHRDLQGETAFVTVMSLANQTVAIRTKAVSDVYFSSDAYDDFGPEHGKYPNFLNLQIPDTRDWEIIERLAHDGADTEDFDSAHVERVRGMIMITDQQYEVLVADGRIKAENLESERAKNQAKSEQIKNLAINTTYQLSSGGVRRTAYVAGPDLLDAFYELVDFTNDVSPEGMLRIEVEGPHRMIFINKEAFDYVSIPTHRFEEGRDERDAEALELTN